MRNNLVLLAIISLTVAATAKCSKIAPEARLRAAQQPRQRRIHVARDPDHRKQFSRRAKP